MKTGGTMMRPRAADDFSMIRARMEELRRERAGSPVEKEVQPVTNTPLYAEAKPRIKPGIPGWRVALRKRYSSEQ
jgi:hypothetical protein